MADPVHRRGEWWQQQPDGTWLRWNEPEGRWQPQEFPPPPPETAPPASSSAAQPAATDSSRATPQPTPGFKYVRADDGTWWARNQTTGELHWHDSGAGLWRRYVDASSSEATPALEGVRYGGFWARVAAAVIDSIVLGAVGGLLIWASLSAAGETTGSTPEETAMLAVSMQFVGALAVWLYDALMESSSKQATLGKMALGLRVTDLHGNRIGFGKATGRHFGKYVSSLILGIGFLMVAWTPQKQGLHDQMAGTLVLKGRRSETSATDQT